MLRITSFILFLCLCLSACSSDEDVIPEENNSEEEITCTGDCLSAKVDGEDFTALFTTAIKNEITWGVDSSDLFISDQLTITGTITSLTSATRTISIVFACHELSNELFVDADDLECGVNFAYNTTSILDPNASVFAIGTEGTVIVEEYTGDRIVGSFSFIGDDSNGNTYTITEGTFDTAVY